MRRAFALVAGVLGVAGCEDAPTMLTVRLVDARPVGELQRIILRTSATYAVEVARVPAQSADGASFRDWVRGRLGGDRPDTIPAVRVAFRPAVVNDSLVVGLALTAGAGFTAFTYVAATGEVTRSPVPEWFSWEVATDLAMPALSPGGRHIAYVARTRDGAVEAVVRSWPDGRVLARGPRGALPAERFPAPARAAWTDSLSFAVVYDVVLPRDFARVSVRGRVGDPALRVDSRSWFPYLDSVRAAARDSAAAESTAAAEARRIVAARLPRLLDSAVHHVRRLPVAAFPDLPAAFTRELDSLGCAVPQAYYDDAPHNVLRGSFGARGQQDWAALCSRALESVILIHWGGPARCPRELRPGRDVAYLVAFDSVHVGYIRAITTTDHHYEYDYRGDPETALQKVALEHDGILEGISEMGAVVWFCRTGEWVQLGAGH